MIGACVLTRLSVTCSPYARNHRSSTNLTIRYSRKFLITHIWALQSLLTWSGTLISILFVKRLVLRWVLLDVTYNTAPKLLAVPHTYPWSVPPLNMALSYGIRSFNQISINLNVFNGKPQGSYARITNLVTLDVLPICYATWTYLLFRSDVRSCA